MRYVYPCVLTPEKDGGYSVSFPDVPEALTCGDDRDEALAMAGDALTVALGSYMQCREDIPAPDSVAGEQEMVAVPLVVAAKLALYTAMREQGLTKVGLARRLGLSEGAVRKLLNPNHRSHIGQIERALAKVGRRLVAEDAIVAPLVPNAATIEAMKEARRGDLPRFASVEELFNDLRADDLSGSAGSDPVPEP